MATTTSRTAENPEYTTTSVNLTRLLSRLEHTVLSSDADPELRASSYARKTVGANLEHARNLLLQLEHSASSIKIVSRKSALQSDLQSKRTLIKQLNQRLYELNQLDDSASSAGSLDTDDEEDADLFPSYAPAVRNTESGIEKTQSSDNAALRDAAENLSSTIRSRRPGPSDPSTVQKENERGTTTGTSLFSNRNPNVDPNLVQTETLLSHNRNEQETLTNSLLTMAQQLKAQSLTFGSTMESDKGVLDRAVGGLDTNTQGMEAAGQRMGTLRRMTEGKGWWDRIKLYAIIGALWVAAFLIVFAMPKLRF